MELYNVKEPKSLENSRFVAATIVYNFCPELFEIWAVLIKHPTGDEINKFVCIDIYVCQKVVPPDDTINLIQVNIQLLLA